MNIFGLTPGELILIMMVAMVVIGPEKLPETAASIGKWVREFRRVTAELTQQFSDENPFTEIQRAFSLTELTNSLNAPLPGTESGESAAAIPLVPDESALVTTAVAASESPFHSSYFDQPAGSTPVEDSWTHSGLDDNVDRYGVRGKPVFTDVVDDQWAHGVPLFERILMEEVPADESPVEALPATDVTPVDLNGKGLAESASELESERTELEAVAAESPPEPQRHESDVPDATAAPDHPKSAPINIASAEPVAVGSVSTDVNST